MLHPFSCLQHFRSSEPEILHKGITCKGQSTLEHSQRVRRRQRQGCVVGYFETDLKRLRMQDKTHSGSDSTDVSAASEYVTTPPGSEDFESAHNFLRNIIQETKAMY